MQSGNRLSPSEQGCLPRSNRFPKPSYAPNSQVNDIVFSLHGDADPGVRYLAIGKPIDPGYWQDAAHARAFFAMARAETNADILDARIPERQVRENGVDTLLSCDRPAGEKLLPALAKDKDLADHVQFLQEAAAKQKAREAKEKKKK